MTCTRSSGSSARSRSTWKPAGPPACRAAARCRCSRCCSCTAAPPFISTASSTSCGRATGRSTRATPSRSWCRGCGQRSARTSCAPRAAATPCALAPGALDADRFEERFRLGREELARGEPWEAAATLGEALALWRGPALADVADERFAQPEVARLEDLRLGCLGERIEADLACGRHAEVAGELEALVREHPLRERLRGQLMLALYRAGRQADALAAYRDAHRALVEGLGIEPSPDLRALEAAILRQDVPEPGAAAARAAERAPDARRWVTCVVSQLAGPDEPALDPESLRAVVERFHATGRAVFANHGGSVVELRSDAVVAVLGVPIGPRGRRAARAARGGGAARRAAVRRALRRLHRRGRRRRRPAGDRRGGRRRRAAGAVGGGRRDPACRVDVAGRAPRRPRRAARGRRLPARRARRRRSRDRAPLRPAADRPRAEVDSCARRSRASRRAAHAGAARPSSASPASASRGSSRSWRRSRARAAPC